MPDMESVDATPSGPATPAAEQKSMTIPERVTCWDEYFLNIAKVVATKSKDPRCAVGAVIVS